MKAKSGRNEIVEPEAKNQQPRADGAANHDEIRRRAYEIYLEGGRLRGRELDDWLRAEQELRKSLFSHKG